MRIALIGDIGGHAAELVAALIGLGADPETLELPDDLTVVQVGDLVNRGPDSEWVLSIVGEQLARPASWVQLIGNHDTMYLTRPQFQFPTEGGAVRETLRNWHAGRKLRAAVALDTEEHGQVLVTHAGLTVGFWRDIGCPTDAGEAAAALNRMLDDGDWRTLLRAGRMLGGGAPQRRAGPIWAEAAAELIDPWVASDQAMPFSQVHGHSSAHWYGTGWRASSESRALTRIDEQRRHVTTRVADHVICGIDPGFGAKARRVSWAPLVLHGSVLR